MAARHRRRDSRQPRDRSRLRARARAARREQPYGVEQWSMALFLAQAGASDPDRPACPGPLLVHANNSFECHGPDCPGGTQAHHPPDVVHPCLDHPELTPYAACHRCARQPRRLAAA